MPAFGLGKVGELVVATRKPSAEVPSRPDELAADCGLDRRHVPEISQRVANETAMVLDEIEARFPPP